MFNRLLLSNRPMELVRKYGIIPPEQYAERQSDAQDGAWLKRLFADVSRQASGNHVMIGLDMYLPLWFYGSNGNAHVYSAHEVLSPHRTRQICRIHDGSSRQHYTGSLSG
jgi:hypothetical protein